MFIVSLFTTSLAGPYTEEEIELRAINPLSPKKQRKTPTQVSLSNEMMVHPQDMIPVPRGAD